MPAAHAVGALAARMARTPVLATIHAMHLSMWDLEVHRLARTHLCVVSEAARAHALSVGVEAARLTLIRNGVDGVRFAPCSTRVRDGDRVVGYVGRLSPEKNPALFLRTAALVLARRPQTRFAVIGDGPMRAELEALAGELAIRHAVAFEGECEDMPERYRGLDLLLATSWHEGTPLAVLEAMASALPVVATDVGGVPELVVSGVTGWLAPPGDEGTLAERVVALLQSRDTMRRFGEAARVRATTSFSLDDQVRRTATLLHALAHADGARPTRAPMRPTLATDRGDAAAAQGS
jgi:glycosyltransferase involved in cell wall biosynthesis